MRANVSGQMVRSAKISPTRFALKRLHPSVLPHVPGQLIRAGKPFLAFRVGARKRFLTRVGAEMGLQVRAFHIGLPTPADRTDVHSVLV